MRHLMLLELRFLGIDLNDYEDCLKIRYIDRALHRFSI